MFKGFIVYPDSADNWDGLTKIDTGTFSLSYAIIGRKERTNVFVNSRDQQISEVGIWIGYKVLKWLVYFLLFLIGMSIFRRVLSLRNEPFVVQLSKESGKTAYEWGPILTFDTPRRKHLFSRETADGIQEFLLFSNKSRRFVKVKKGELKVEWEGRIYSDSLFYEISRNSKLIIGASSDQYIYRISTI